MEFPKLLYRVGRREKKELVSTRGKRTVLLRLQAHHEACRCYAHARNLMAFGHAPIRPHARSRPCCVPRNRAYDPGRHLLPLTVFNFVNPFTCVPAMERANDMTWSCLDLRSLPALPVAWLPPGQQHSPQVSWQPIQISVFLQIEAAPPIYGYVQSPDFTPATSSPP